MPNQTLNPIMGATVLPCSVVVSMLLQADVVPSAHCGLAWPLYALRGSLLLFDTASRRRTATLAHAKEVSSWLLDFLSTPL